MRCKDGIKKDMERVGEQRQRIEGDGDWLREKRGEERKYEEKTTVTMANFTPDNS